MAPREGRRLVTDAATVSVRGRQHSAPENAACRLLAFHRRCHRDTDVALAHVQGHAQGRPILAAIDTAPIIAAADAVEGMKRPTLRRCL